MKYKIIYQEEAQIKTKIVDTQCLQNEQLPKYVIEVKKIGFVYEKKYSIAQKDLTSRLYELSMMLDANILLDEALSIIIQKEKKQNLKEFFLALQSAFASSSNMHENLQKFNISPLIKGFFYITQECGDTTSNMHSLYHIVCEDYAIKKEFIKILMYPMILFITLIFSLVALFKFVVPKFEFIFAQTKTQLSFATKSLLYTKNFFDHYLLFFIGGIVLFLLILFGLYKHNIKYKKSVDKVLFSSIPVLSEMYRYKILYSFFLSISILLKNHYEFYDALTKAKVLLNNQYLFDKITFCSKLLENGNCISDAFRKSMVFDEMVMSLIYTAQMTNRFDTIISDIAKIYKKRFEEKLKLFSVLLEPIFFIIILGVIVWIILAVFVPLWSLGDMLKA